MTALGTLGAALLLLCGTVAAAYAVSAERARLQTLREWIDLITLMREQIDCYLMPVGAILSRADSDLVRACRAAGIAPSADACLTLSAGRLGKEEAGIIGDFVKELGGVYREEQVRRCDRTLTALRALSERRERELPARIRLSVTLCLSAALGALVLLW